MPPCLTLSIIRYGSRVKWRNPGKGVASSPTPWCSSYRKRCLQVTLDYGRQLYLLTLYINQAIGLRVECSLMVKETWVQSQVKSYQRLKKWYLMPPCLTSSIIRSGYFSKELCPLIFIASLCFCMHIVISATSG